MNLLTQKVALVTWAGSGIGKAIAKLFAEQCESCTDGHPSGTNLNGPFFTCREAVALFLKK